MAARADLVSIIIPCFNAQRWLADTIDSALSQTANVEVIVVDDGSRDDSVEIARSYGDRVRVDARGVNEGPGAARNRGIALATGRWIQLIDSDDLLLPNKVADGLAAAEQPGDIPFSGFLSFGQPHASRVRSLLASMRAEPAVFDPTKPVLTALTFPIQTGQALMPVDMLRQIGGFRTELRWLEDIDLNLRLALAGARFVPVGSVGVMIREHASPGRQRLAPGAALGQLAGEHAMMATIRAAGRWDHEVATLFGHRLAYAGRKAYLAGEIDAAKDAFALARSLARHPRPTSIPLYNALSALLGLERNERAWSLLRSK